MNRPAAKPSMTAVRQACAGLDNPEARARRQARYESARNAWLADNPAATPAEIEAQSVRIGRQVGL